MKEFKKKHLALFTNQFPFGYSETFLETEIQYLSSAFKKITIFPSQRKKCRRDVPENVIIDNSFANFLEEIDKNSFELLFKGLPRVLSKVDFYNRLRIQPARYLHPAGLKRVSVWAGKIYWIKRSIDRLLQKIKLDNSETLFYTYWFNLTTVALSESLSQSKVISRAHGFDLYDERNGWPYTSWKFLGLKKLDLLFLISQDGLHYMRRNYTKYQEKYKVSRLGVGAPGFVCESSQKGIVNIVSVSSITEVKRIHLIVLTIARLSQLIPQVKVSWNHFGDGPLMEKIEALVEREIPESSDVVLHGMVSNNEIMNYYRKNSVDLFINLSSSEGIPVSIMEAQSVGIPVMAANVGGVSEIVDNENGFLLDINSEPALIAKKIKELYNSKARLNKKKEKSLQNWEQNFNAKMNYKQFSELIAQL